MSWQLFCPSETAPLHMDVLPRITRQLIELVREMSPVQRATMIAIPAALLLGFGWLVFLNTGSDFRELSFGKSFSSDEMASAEQALIAAGLSGFRREGQRLLARGKELDRYNAALLQSDALPGDLGAQMLKQFESLGPFSTDRQRQQMKEALLLQELRRMIKAVPEIQDARVVIASSERRTTWNQKPQTSANVMVKPRSDREISPMLVNSLRQVVASMVPDLKPADVTIFDVSKGQAFTGESAESPIDSRLLRHAQALTRHYEQQIHKALAHIPNVSVTAHVDFDALKSSIIHSEPPHAVRSALSPHGHEEPLIKNHGFDPQESVHSHEDDFADSNHRFELDRSDAHETGFRGSTNRSSEATRGITDKQLMASMPRSVQVSICIPRDYIREIVAGQIAKGEKAFEKTDPGFVEEEVLSKVEQIVGRLIPADSPGDAISVTCIDRLDREVADITSLPLRERIAILAHRWGNSIALGVLALVAIWMIRRSTSAPVVNLPRDTTAEVSTENVDSALAPAEPMPIAALPKSPDRMEVLRDEIRSTVESDSTASSTLLGRWLSDAETSPDHGTRKAAILLLSLDQGLAAKLLGLLPRDQVERITLTIAGVEGVTRDEQELVLDEFKTMFASRPLMHAGGPETARELLERTLDRNEVEPLTQRIEDQIQAGPFAFLHGQHPDDIRRLIDDEHPQSIAVICSQLPPQLAAQILAGFGAESQADILGRVARMGPTDSDLLIEIAALLRSRVGRVPVRNGGMTRAAEVLRESPRTTSRSVLQSLQTKDAKLAESLRSSMFTFKDLTALDSAALQLVLQKTDHFAWSVALKGSSESLRQHVFKGLSPTMSQALKEEINSVGPLRLSEITAVQHQIAEAIFLLESDNQIELPRHLSRLSRAETV